MFVVVTFSIQTETRRRAHLFVLLSVAQVWGANSLIVYGSLVPTESINFFLTFSKYVVSFSFYFKFYICFVGSKMQNIISVNKNCWIQISNILMKNGITKLFCFSFQLFRVASQRVGLHVDVEIVCIYPPFFPARRLSPPLVTLFVSWLHLDPGQNQLFEAFCTRTRGRKSLAEGRRGENKQQQRKRREYVYRSGMVSLVLNVGRRWIRSPDVKSLKMWERQRARFM